MKASKGSEETTPLLKSTSKPASETPQNGVEASNGGETISDEGDDTLLPKLQIFLLCFARLVDPITFFVCLEAPMAFVFLTN